MSAQSQILDIPNNNTTPASEQGRSIQPQYAPFDLLLIPYRDRLLHLRQAAPSTPQVRRPPLKEPSWAE